MIKIALALIVKGTDEEAVLLHRCLRLTAPYVDGIFITATYRNSVDEALPVQKVCEKYNANLVTFQWVNDFAKARNFNFSQIPKEYTHILWCDADDGIRGLEHLKKVIEENPSVDAFTFNYLYAFDEYKQPVVVHLKTQVVKNDGCVVWAGALHEDFKETRAITAKFVKDIERIHLTTEERIDKNKERNIEVAKADMEVNPNDPRSYWNYGNSLFGAAKYKEAGEVFSKFIDLSNSEEEKYLVYLKLSSINDFLGNKGKSIEYARMAIGMRPSYPDAYHHLGQIYYNQARYKEASEMILQGLTKKPPYYSIIVYNPREYDVVPMMLLAKTFYQLSRPDQAITCLDKVLEMEPKNATAKSLRKALKSESKIFDRAIKIIKKLQKITDKNKLKKALDEVPDELKSYPGICHIRNTNFIKEKSSGKDLVFYCGYTTFEWGPEMAKTKGVGGSEESVLNLSREFVKQGWNVTVYNNIGHKEEVHDGVLYKPFWEWNVRDKQDIVILWRSPRPIDFNINCEKIIIDLHDVISPGEFTEERLKKIYKIFVKTQFHRSLFPNVPDEKMTVIPNGMDFELFNQDIKKDQYLLVNTSSPDRSMDVLPKLFKRVREQVPEAKCKWAYGFDIFDQSVGHIPKMQAWKEETLKTMEDAGIENLGRLSQKECAKLYLQANILAYPTEFAEIDCITVKKAQACGAVPVTTNFGALEQSVQYGVKIPSLKTKDTWCLPGQFHFGLEDELAQTAWVNAVVKILKTPIDSRKEMMEWTHKFEWSKVASLWNNALIG